jgi:hypothetical protein
VGGVYADGLHTIATVALSGVSGNTVEQALIFHLDDGKVTEFWSLPTEAAVAAALVSGEDVPAHPYMDVFETAEATRERNTFEPEDIANIHAFLREDVEFGTEDGRDGGEPLSPRRARQGVRALGRVRRPGRDRRLLAPMSADQRTGRTPRACCCG